MQRSWMWSQALLAVAGMMGCAVEDMAAPEDGAAEVDLTETQQPVVYGTDNRQDVYAHPDFLLRERAKQSTVALISPAHIDMTDPDDIGFDAPTLQVAEDLCPSQRFLADPTAAFCSGTLIDDNLVLTAGHCITTAADCANTRFVFKYYRDTASTLETITSQDVFSCSSIVAHRNGVVNGQTLDYAIVRLDRSAVPRFTPAPIRQANFSMEVNRNVAVIGSGSGIPFKIDSGGAVRDGRAGTLDYFVANTDTFEGNSGSGVYETRGHTIAGILVRGDTDYVASGSCNVVNTCTSSGCSGESITYVRPAIDHFCEVSNSTRLCGTVRGTYNYSTANTNSAQQNTVNQLVSLTVGQQITIGTCGLPLSSFTGDTFLRLRGPANTEVAFNDDACNGNGSRITYTANTAGNYEIRGGCYGASACSAVVTVQISGGAGELAFSTSNTNNASQNTVNQNVTLRVGETIILGTCGVAGGKATTGNTFLRLVSPTSTLVASNDNACGGTASNITYKAPVFGTYQIRAGCAGTGSCSGAVAWTLH